MKSLLIRAITLTNVSLVLASLCYADDKKSAKITYDDQIVPILRDKCFSCHNQDKKSAGLVLNNFAKLMEGGASGKIVEAGDPDSSRLWEVVDHQAQPFMPPKSPKLAKEQLDLIKQWIAGGALENSGSTAKAMNKPKADFSLAAASIGKPEGPPPMPGRLNLEPVVRTAKANAIIALAASPWAPLVAVGSEKQVILYHSDTLEILGILPFPEGVPQVLKFSRNGSLLLAGGGRGAKLGRVVVWSVTTGERLFEIGEEFDCILAADISSDQSKIALGGPGKVVRIYSTKDGKLVHEIKKHTDWIYSLEFSPDGVLLASGDRNGGLFVWEAHNAQEYFSLRGHTAAITDLSWRADSNVLASGSEDTTIRTWEMENGGQIKAWGAHAAGVQSVKFAHDGRIASCGRDLVPKVWDQNGGQQRAFEAFPDLALRVAFSHDGSRIVAGSWTGEVRVWATADGKRLGNVAANPPTIAERLDAASKELAARKTAHDQIAPVAAASKAAAEKASAGLAVAEKAAAEAGFAAKVLGEAFAKAKDAADKATAALSAAQTALPAKDAATKLLAESAAKAKEAADKLKGDKELADHATRSQQIAAKSAAELAAAQKAITDLAVAAKQAGEQVALAQNAAGKSKTEANAVGQVLEPKRAAAKLASDKAAADRAALHQAAGALASAQAAVEKWSTALAEAKKKTQPQAG